MSTNRFTNGLQVYCWWQSLEDCGTFGLSCLGRRTPSVGGRLYHYFSVSSSATDVRHVQVLQWPQLKGSPAAVSSCCGESCPETMSQKYTLPPCFVLIKSLDIAMGKGKVTDTHTTFLVKFPFISKVLKVL